MRFLTYFLAATMLLMACKPNAAKKAGIQPLSSLPVKTAIRLVDTQVNARLYHQFEIKGLNIIGCPFRTTPNITLYQDSTRLVVIPLDTGMASITSWRSGRQDTFLRVRIAIAADSYLLATQARTRHPTELHRLDSFQSSMYNLGYQWLNTSFPDSFHPPAVTDQQPFSNIMLQGKTTSINCWYYGCPACMWEIESLEPYIPLLQKDTSIQLLSFFRDSAYVEDGEAVFYNTYLEINNSFGSKKARKVVEYSPISYPVKHYFNLKYAEDQLPTTGYPQTFIIDKQGIIRYIFIGSGNRIARNIADQILLYQNVLPYDSR